MSLFEKCSVYEQPSVYNQGGGGSQVQFNVVLNNQNNKMVFPPYLIPVEYINMENFAGNDASIRGEFQLRLTATQVFKIVFSINLNKMPEGECYVMQCVPALGESGTDNYITLRITQSKQIGLFYGKMEFYYIDGSGLNFNDKLTLICSAQQKKTIVHDEHGHTVAKTTGYNPTTPLLGAWAVFGNAYAMQTKVNYSKFHYAHIIDGDDVAALWIPAKRNDNVDGAYIAECVRGVVGVNWTYDTTTTGIEFGPEIDLDNVQQYFE